MNRKQFLSLLLLTASTGARRSTAMALLSLLLVLAQPGRGASMIAYEATDLNDSPGPGGDLWSYSFTPSGYVFNANFGFSIAFDPALYRALQDPPPLVNADWDVITLQPDTNLPDDGFYDALALTDNASLANPFTVSFVWLGVSGTRPGAQPFTINQFDAGGNFLGTVQSGSTQSVPEPGAAVLAVAGLCVWLRARRGRRACGTPAAFAFACLALATAGEAAPTIGNYEVVSTTRVGRTDFEYAIRAKATNTGPAVTGVSGIVTSTSPATTIVKNSLQFGEVATGATKTSTDTFKIRQDRRFPFNPAALQWQVSTLDVPDAWAGEWKITIAYHDAETAELQSEETNTLVFCTGETFGLSPLQDTCTGTVTETSVQITFDAQITIGTCTQTAHCGLAINRTGNTMTGSGQWSVAVQGNCPAASSGAQTFTVSGVQLNKAQGGCGNDRSVLLRRILPFPASLSAN